MKRLTVVLSCVVALLFVGYVIQWFVTVGSKGDRGLSIDEHRALRVLVRVQRAEGRCYKARGQYMPLQDLGPGGCGGLERDLSAGADDGFTVEVSATADMYSVKVYPADTTKLFFLYSDQTGVPHYGTRDKSTSVQSR